MTPDPRSVPAPQPPAQRSAPAPPVYAVPAHRSALAHLIFGPLRSAPLRSRSYLAISMHHSSAPLPHVAKTVACCFAVLCQIRSIRQSVTRPVLQSLAVSMVLTSLDYGSSTLTGLSNQLNDRLQSVLHAATRLIYSARKYDHITPLLRDLHWLRVKQRTLHPIRLV